MPDKADRRTAARTTVVLALTLLTVVALRGYLPDHAGDPPPDESRPAGTGSLVAVTALLAVSIVVIALAVITQASQRSARPSGGSGLRPSRKSGFALRRPLLIAAAALLAWALLILLLMRWGTPVTIEDPPQPDPPAGAGAGATDPGATPPPPPETPTGQGGRGMFAALAGTTIALFVLAIVATLASRRRAPETPAPPGFVAADMHARAEAPDLARAAELGLAEMDDPRRDPRQAIIACYLAMERELEKSPGTTPRESDTPTEVLARAIESRALTPDSATELVELFEEARFSSHVMDEAHRADAVRALQQVQRQLEATT